MDLIEVFKTGTHTDSQGRTREWTEKDLQEIAAQYDPAHHEAPVVVGHPEADSPAYGWVEKLRVEGGRLKAELKNLAPEFVDWVKRGLYKKISIALYPDMGLRHVGFLGAVPPAIKGLKQATFAEKSAWTIETENRTEDSGLRTQPNTTKGGKKMDMKEFWEKLKGLFAEAEKGLDVTQSSVLSPQSSDVRFTEADLRAAEERGKASLFAEVERLKKEKTDTDAALRQAQGEREKEEAKTRKDGILAFCEGLCKDGKLTPALRKIIEPIMIAVSLPPLHRSTAPDGGGEGKGGDGLIEFAEGVKKTALDGLKDFLTELPKVVTFREVAGGTGPGSGGTAGEKLSALTKRKMEEKKDLPYSAAFAEVQRENPDLTTELLGELTRKN